MEAADIIRGHLNDDVYALSAKDKWFENYDKRWLLQQIQSRQKARLKLPSWYGNFNLLFPPPLSVEQASSELTAAYKAQIMADRLSVRGSLLDLTGGMGVDSAAFATRFQQVTYVEKQPELAEIAKHNFCVLGLNHIAVMSRDCIDFLEKSPIPQQDCIFADPARRKNGLKVFRPEDCTPNLLNIMPALLKKTKSLLLKLSPMMDIHLLLHQIPQTDAVHIVAVHNEVKELLLCVFNTEKWHNHDTAPQIFCVNLENNSVKKNQFDYSQRNETINWTDKVGSYLYEPHPALMKAGMMNAAAKLLKLRKLHPQSHLYTSDNLQNDFFGRIFRVEGVFGMGKSELKNGLAGLDKAHLTVRNFPIPAASLRKKLKIAEGGDITLFATTLIPNKHLIIKGIKIN